MIPDLIIGIAQTGIILPTLAMVPAKAEKPHPVVCAFITFFLVLMSFGLFAAGANFAGWASFASAGVWILVNLNRDWNE